MINNKKKYIAKNILKMPTSGIRKFFDVVNTMDNVISLGVGEPDFETPWYVREEAIRSIEKGKTSYTSNQGMIELRKSISEYLLEKYNLNYDSEKEVLVTVGASEGIDIALRTICEVGDEILVVEPSYVSYKPCIIMAGGVPITITTTEKNDFRLKLSDIKKKITDRTKAIIMSYPNNPTGAIMEKKDLEEIAKILIEKDIIVISDEIYSELTYGRNHISIASIEGMRERTIVLNGFSKSFAMTGWRLGYVVAPEIFVEQMIKIHQYIIMCAPTMSQFAALEALKNQEREESIDIMRDSYDERRRIMLKAFRSMGLYCFEPLGAFYLFPCIKSTGFTSEEFCEKLLYEQNVAVVPGTAFGECGEGFVRCSYAYSLDIINEAISRIENFMKKIE